MNLTRRLEALEAVIVRRQQEAPDLADVSRLSTDELRDLEALRAKACGDGGAWDLSKLADNELRTLRALLQKASTGDVNECSRNDRH